MRKLSYSARNIIPKTPPTNAHWDTSTSKPRQARIPTHRRWSHKVFKKNKNFKSSRPERYIVALTMLKLLSSQAATPTLPICWTSKSMLLGSLIVGALTPSIHHPIQNSLNATHHHDPMILVALNITKAFEILDHYWCWYFYQSTLSPYPSWKRDEARSLKSLNVWLV